MYELELAKKYRKSYEKLSRSGIFPKEEIDFVVDELLVGKKLAKHYYDHLLKGRYLGFRECHIRGDLLLIYRKKSNPPILVLFDIGSHSELFG